MEIIRKMVSVVVPVYQAVNYLPDCVESILNQTYQRIEIILIDDGSDDGSGELCDAYSQKYKNVFSIHQKNQGVSNARNQGIHNARGEFILFVDSDDFIVPDYLENAMSALKDEDIDMYVCGYQNVRNRRKIKEKKYYPSVSDGMWQHNELCNIMMKLYASTTLHAIGTKIYKKSLIEKYVIRFREKWRYYEDIYFCLRYLSYCNRIYVKNKVMYHYQKDIDYSLSKQMRNHQYMCVYKTYSLLYELVDMNDLVNQKMFCKSYLVNVNLCVNSKISIEKRYTKSVHKLYKKLSEDSFYKKVLPYAQKNEKAELFCVNNGFYYCAYLIRRYFIKTSDTSGYQ